MYLNVPFEQELPRIDDGTGQAPITYEAGGDPLPAGIMYNAETGFLEGTPTELQADERNHYIEATDSARPQRTARYPFRTTVLNPGPVLTIIAPEEIQTLEYEVIFRFSQAVSGLTSSEIVLTNCQILSISIDENNPNDLTLNMEALPLLREDTPCTISVAPGTFHAEGDPTNVNILGAEAETRYALPLQWDGELPENEYTFFQGQTIPTIQLPSATTTLQGASVTYDNLHFGLLTGIGLTYNEADRTITGTILETATLSTLSFSWRASDGTNRRDFDFQITVVEPPSVPVFNNPTASFDVNLDQTTTILLDEATDATSYEILNRPDWIVETSIDRAFNVTAGVDQRPQQTITWQATNAGGSVTQQVFINVIDPAEPLFTPNSGHATTPPGETTQVSFPNIDSGTGYGNITYAVVNPPDWLTRIGSSNDYNAAPAADDTSVSVTWRATDSIGRTTDFTMRLDVEAHQAPDFGQVPEPYSLGTVEQGETETGNLPTALGGGRVDSYSASGLPVWLTVDDDSRDWSASPGTGVTPDTYSFTWTATGPGGTDTRTVQIVVEPPNVAPTLSLVASPATIRSDQTSTITATASDSDGSISSYQWSASDGTIEGDSFRVVFTPPNVNTDTDITITCIVTDDDGAETSANTTVTVTPQPPEFLADSFIIARITQGETESGTLPAASEAGPATSYSSSGVPSWITVNDSTRAWSASPTTSTSTGNHSFTWTATGPGGNDSTTIIITVTAADQNPTVTLSGPSTIRADQTATIEATASDPDGTISSYAWSTTQGSITGSGSSVTFNPPNVSSSTAVTITCTVTDDDGLTDSATHDITVTPQPPEFLANSYIIANIVQGETESGTLPEPSEGGPVSSYSASGVPSWVTVNTGTRRWSASPSASQSTGNYDFTWTATGPGGSDSTTIIIRVIEPDDQPPTVSLSGPSTIRADQTATIEATASDPDGTISSYAWSTTQGSITGSGSSVTFNPPNQDSSTTATITCTVTDNDGLTDSATHDITVTPQPPEFLRDTYRIANIVQGESDSGTLPAASEGGPISSYSASGLPTWVTVNNSTRAWSASPGAGVDAGNYDFTWTATNGGGSDSTTIRITVTESNKLPTVSLSGPATIRSDQTATITATASDEDGTVDSYTWSTTEGTITGSGSSVTFNPPYLSSNTNVTITCTVTDDDGAEASATHSITVTPEAPEFSEESPFLVATITQGTTERGTLPEATAGGAVASYTSQSNRAWITINTTTREWSASPTLATSAVTYNLGWTARNETGSDRITIQFRVIRPGNQPPTVSLEGPSTVRSDQTATITATAEDEDGTVDSYAWSASQGSITGSGSSVTFNPPNVSSSTVVTITCTVTDDDGETGRDTHSITVTPEPPDFNLQDPFGIVSVPQGGTASGTLPTADDGGLVSSYAASGLPTWVTVDNSTRAWTASPGTGTAPGNYDFTWTATNDSGSDSVTIRITVTEPSTENQAPTVSLSGPSTVRADSTAEITATANDVDGIIASYAWSASQGSMSGSGAVGTFTPPSVGSNTTVTITCTVTDDDGATGDDTHTITVTPEPPEFGLQDPFGITSVEQGETESGTLPTADDGGPVNSYAASGLPTWVTVNNSTRAWTASPGSGVDAGNYDFTWTATNGGGSDSVTIRITVTDPDDPNQAPTVSLSGASEVDAGDTTSITATANDVDGIIASYTWSVNFGSISGNGAIGTYTAPDTSSPLNVTITCEVTDDDGATASATHDILVEPLNIAPTVSLSGPATLRADQTATITATASDSDGTIASYGWDASEGSISGSGSSVTFNPPNVGSNTTVTITCTVTDDDGARANATHSITVTPEPPDFTLQDPFGITSVAQGETASGTLPTADGGGLVNSYAASGLPSWVTVNNSTRAWTASPGAGTDPGNYDFTWTATNGGGSDSVTIRITVTDPPDPNEPPTVSLSGPDEVADNETAQITASANDTDGIIVSYSWSTTAGTISGSGAVATFDPPDVTASMNVDITCTVTDDDGDTGEDTHTITVNDGGF